MKRIIAILATLVLLVAILLPAPVSAEEPLEGYYHYIGYWVQKQLSPTRFVWTAPEGAISWIDLRGDGGSTVENPGLMFIVSPVPLSGKDILVSVGRKWADEFPVQVRNFFRNRYDITLPTLDVYTTRGLIWSLFVEHGSPTGAWWRTYEPMMDGSIVFYLDGYSPVTFIKDTPREKLGRGWCWKGKWERKWDTKFHHWINHWQYFRQRALR